MATASSDDSVREAPATSERPGARLDTYTRNRERLADRARIKKCHRTGRERRACTAGARADQPRQSSDAWLHGDGGRRREAERPRWLPPEADGGAASARVGHRKLEPAAGVRRVEGVAHRVPVGPLALRERENGSVERPGDREGDAARRLRLYADDKGVGVGRRTWR